MTPRADREFNKNFRFVAILSLVLLVTTVTPIASSAEFGSCSATVKKNTLATVKGQSAALAKSDFKGAFSYSAASFRAAISLSDFTSIITQGYGFLADAKKFTVTSCQVLTDVVSLSIRITDKSDQIYPLIYRLKVQGKQELIAPNRTGYGITAAELDKSSGQSI